MSRECWTNWAGNHSCSARLVSPRSREELCEVVRSAAREGRSIRAAGGSFSWAPLIPNDGIIVSMRQLDGVLAYDEDAHTIEVECGMTIEALTKHAAARGMTVTSPTLFPDPTVGGALSTGSHGTDSRAGNFADSIVGMTIVDARGEPRRLRRDARELPAARVALGALGVVYAVELQLVPQYQVCVAIHSLPVRRVLSEFADLQNNSEFLELFWFPFQPNMWVYVMNRTTTPADPKNVFTRATSGLKTAIEGVAAKALIPWIARHAPRLTPALNSLASRMAFDEQIAIQCASEAFHFQKAYAKCWDLEYAVPAADAARAWGAAISLVNHYANTSLYPVNLAVHGRFTGPSEAWIAPDHDRPTCYVEVTSAMGTPHWESFFREMELEWCAIPGARPHWGKLYWQRDRIAAQYPMMNAFLDIRQSWDSERIFLNRFLERRIFQLPARPAPAVQPFAAPPPGSATGFATVQPLLLS